MNRAAVNSSVTNLKFIKHPSMISSKFRPGRHNTVFSVLEVHTETLNGSGFFLQEYLNTFEFNHCLPYFPRFLPPRPLNWNQTKHTSTPDKLIHISTPDK